jgi:hypothetical protein
LARGDRRCDEDAENQSSPNKSGELAGNVLHL